MKEKTLAEILETILFITPRSLTVTQLLELMEEDYTPQEVRTTIKRLNYEYEETGRIFRIEATGGGFQMRTQPHVREWIRKIDAVKPFKLSPANLETLSIVAYKQPITRAQVEYIRGVDSSHTLRTLMQRRLIRITGREALPGRPALYGTTKTFLEIFGLKSLKELPTLSELDMDKEDSQMALPLESE